jgi:hypothetical protein
MSTSIIPQEIDSIINGELFDEKLCSYIKEWSESVSFCKYLHEFKDKVAKKLRKAANHEAQRDIGLELFVAYAFGEVGCSITNEPFPQDVGGPDLKISTGKGEFLCEIKRYHGQKLYDSWETLSNEIREQVDPYLQDYSITLTIKMSYSSYEFRNVDYTPFDVVIDNREALIEFIQSIAQGQYPEEVEIDVPCLLKGFSSLIVTPVVEGEEPTFCSIFPIMDYKEYRTFKDIICKNIKQLKSNIPNVFYIGINNVTHTREEFETAINIMFRLLEKEPGKFLEFTRFKSTENFTELWANCSAIIIQDSSDEQAALWENSNSDNKLTKEMKAKILEALKIPFSKNLQPRNRCAFCKQPATGSRTIVEFLPGFGICKDCVDDCNSVASDQKGGWQTQKEGECNLCDKSVENGVTLYYNRDCDIDAVICNECLIECAKLLSDQECK